MGGPGKIRGGGDGGKARGAESLRFKLDDPRQLREQIVNHLRQLGVSDKNIDRLIKYSNVLEAFREVYKGGGPDSIANIEVKQVRGETIVNLTLKEKFTFCSQKGDYGFRKCTSSSHVAFRDSYVLTDEASKDVAKKITKAQKRPLPAVARSRKKKAARKVPKKAEKKVAMAEEKFSLINNDSLARLEARNVQSKYDSNEEWNNTPFDEIRGSREILIDTKGSNGCSSKCTPSPSCYENGDIHGRPRWDLIRSGVCRFCGS